MTSLLKPRLISPKEAQNLIEKSQLVAIDVREPSEFAAGHISSGRLVPLATVGEASKGWKKDEPLLLYCQSGRRSAQAGSLLALHGFTNLSDLEGGISAWSAAGLPTEKSDNAPWALERQVRFAVAVFVILFTSLGLLVHPAFFVLDFLISGGLIFSAVTNTCGMALVLTKMPWNRVLPS